MEHADLSLRGLWRDGRTVIRRGWRAAFVAQLVCKAIAILLFAPIGIAVVNALLGESVSIGNVALARFALSPAGVVAIVLIPSMLLAQILFEQAIMVSIASDAFDRPTPRLLDALAVVLWRLPRLVLLAMCQVVIAVVLASPFVALAGATYWLLLSDADINFYLSIRPPVFVVAAAIGVLLAIGCAMVLTGFYIRAFLAVPIAIFQDLRAREALRESAVLSRDRRHEVAIAAVAWLALRFISIAVGLIVLRALVWIVLSQRTDNLLTVMWLIAGLIVFAGGAFALGAAIDRAGLATLVTLLYRRLTDPSAQMHVESSPAPRDRRRTLVLGVVVLSAVAIAGAQSILLVERFTDRRRIVVTAHRAGAIRGIENTLGALRLAIAERADFAEIDVQRSSDGVVVVIHDRDLKRLANSPLVVADSTAKQLASVHFAGERVATLDEFIDAARGKIRLSIELKYYGRGDPQLADAVVKTLREKQFLDQASIISLEYAGLAQARKLEPRLPLGFLVSASLGDLTKLDVDFLSVSTSRFTPKLRRQADARNLPVAVWTVNDRSTMVRMIARGADDLVTDDPALCVETVRWYTELSDVELILLRFREWLAE